MKLNHLIAATALAALASGSVLAQTGGGASGAGSSVNGVLSGAKDKMQDEKSSNNLSGKLTKKDAKTSSTNPITVTPPSQDDPNLRTNVDTDNADANAAAGQSGVSANANLQGPDTTARNGKTNVKPITDKLKKSDNKNSDHK